MELKDIHKRYLHQVYWYGNEARFVANAADSLGIDRRKANSIFNSLAEMGFLAHDGSVCVLSEKGRAGLSPQLEQSAIAALWLKDSGMDERRVRKEAFDLILSLSPRMAAWLCAEWLFMYALQTGPGRRRGMAQFSGARWPAALNVQKHHGRGRSMGQKGIKEASVVLRAGRLYLELTSKMFRHTPESGGASAKGKLTKLLYRSAESPGDWQEVIPRRNVWQIPLDAMRLEFREATITAVTSVLASAGENCGMPENSAAELVCLIDLRKFFSKAVSQE
jgi:Mn-dependent DtxR family transcriptional regulator